MADTKQRKTKQNNQLVGSQAKPTVLGDTTKLDIDTNKKLADLIIDTGLNGGLDISALERFTSVSNNREQIYTVIDTMSRDSAVSSIIKTYADCACDVADNGHVMWCESPDPKISKYVNYLLNVMNVDKNIYRWTYCLVKYGDVYLKLYRESDYDDGPFNRDNIDKAYAARNVLNEQLKSELSESVNLSVHSSADKYSYYVEMVSDPSTMFELTRFGKTCGYIEVPNKDDGFDVTSGYTGINDLTCANYKMKSTDVNVYQADDFVHALLDDNYDRFPEKVDLFLSDDDYKNDSHAYAYTVRRGKSMLIDNYKVWREKALLESAILLNRVTKSSIVRKISVEVGDMPKEQVSQVLRRVKEMFEQKTAIDANKAMADYNNPGPVENNIYFATHNGQGAITVEAVGGDIDVKGLADLDEWVNKYYSGFGVPKAYFGHTEDGAGFNGGSSLSIISSVFAKAVKHVQSAMIQALTDAVTLILINNGLKRYANNFVLKMKAPVTQEERDYRDDLSNRINAVNQMNGLFSGIEDKARQLTILKSLVATLNYGDGITAELDQEIKAVQEREKAEREQAERDAAEQARIESAESAGGAGEPAEEEPEGGEDLGLSSIATESLKRPKPTEALPDIPTANDDLPTPGDLAEGKDFSDND